VSVGYRWNNTNRGKQATQNEICVSATYSLYKGQVASNRLRKINQLVQLKGERIHSQGKGVRERGDLLSLLSLFNQIEQVNKKKRGKVYKYFVQINSSTHFTKPYPVSRPTLNRYNVRNKRVA
jgi:hypothetical protein